MSAREDLFCDLKEPLDLKKAQIEASRCYFCYEAPCIQACPTHIDIPSFIRKIQTGNLKGSALDILSANIMGGTCARACPVETLCEKACVRNTQEDKPVVIGQLQRFATDEYFKRGEQPFKRETPNGKRIAVVGAGPAGLSCAHQLARLGYEISVYEAKEKAGGLNEYGLAPYKMTDDWAQKEIEFILSVGGITVHNGKALGRDVTLDDLRKKYEAVFLSIGLNDTHRLGIEGEDLKGVEDAVRRIAQIRQAQDFRQIPVGDQIIVIGGGNTAIDIAVEMKKLGAQSVTLVYRRGEEHMGATWHEREVAKLNGVVIRTWAKPHRILGGQKSEEMEFEETELDAKGNLKGRGRFFRLKAEQIYKAIGQKLSAEPFRNGATLPETAGGKFVVDKNFHTSVDRVYAGGDCTGEGEDLTVTAVAQGKQAALAIHSRLSTQGVNRG